MNDTVVFLGLRRYNVYCPGFKVNQALGKFQNCRLKRPSSQPPSPTQLLSFLPSCLISMLSTAALFLFPGDKENISVTRGEKRRHHALMDSQSAS